MITVPAYQGKKVGVFGLARSGLAAVHSLVASGAHVCAWDDNSSAREKVRGYAVDLYSLDFAGLDAFVLAPGVPLTHPEPHPLVVKANAASVPVICDMDVFQAARQTLPSHKVIGITGTNGKSTTTALIGHVLACAGKPVAIGGNIGNGVLSLEPLPAGGLYVFELSSFQLDLCHSLNCDVSVLLNISPDHLDRHGNMAGYVAAKSRLFDLQTGNCIAVVGVDDEHSRSIAARQSNLLPVSVRAGHDDGIYVRDGVLFDHDGQNLVEVGSILGVASLQGTHNWQNAAAAYAACKSVGLSSSEILSGLLTFPGLEHRQEIVPYKKGITVVNDSKATNIDAALRALKTFDRVRWIAGGRAKDKNFSELSKATAGVEKAYLMGEDARLIADVLPESLPFALHGTMLEALEDALGDVRLGETVLLSPACTAFDQFTDFEKRGEAFKDAVIAAAGESA